MTVTATTSIPKASCPTCWSSNCIADQEFAPGKRYGHRWEDGPMTAGHARWKDERTPPASFEEAIERGFIKPEAVTDVPTEPVTDTPVTDSPSAPVTDNLRPCEACNTPFEPKRADARFCSATCRQRAHRRETEAVEPAP